MGRARTGGGRDGGRRSRWPRAAVERDALREPAGQAVAAGKGRRGRLADADPPEEADDPRRGVGGGERGEGGGSGAAGDDAAGADGTEVGAAGEAAKGVAGGAEQRRGEVAAGRGGVAVDADEPDGLRYARVRDADSLGVVARMYAGGAGVFMVASSETESAVLILSGFERIRRVAVSSSGSVVGQYGREILARNTCCSDRTEFSITFSLSSMSMSSL